MKHEGKITLGTCVLLFFFFFYWYSLIAFLGRLLYVLIIYHLLQLLQRESPPENTANIAYEFLPSLPYVLYLSVNTYAAEFECSAVHKQDQFVFSIHQKCIAVSHAPSYLKNTLFIIDEATFWFVLRKMVYH